MTMKLHRVLFTIVCAACAIVTVHSTTEECESEVTEMIRNAEYTAAIIKYYIACLGSKAAGEECDTTEYKKICLGAEWDYFTFSGKAVCDQGTLTFGEIPACLPVSCDRDESLLIDLLVESPINDGTYTNCDIDTGTMAFEDSDEDDGSSAATVTITRGDPLNATTSPSTRATASMGSFTMSIVTMAVTGLAWFAL